MAWGPLLLALLFAQPAGAVAGHAAGGASLPCDFRRCASECPAVLSACRDDAGLLARGMGVPENLLAVAPVWRAFRYVGSLQNLYPKY